MSPEQAREQMRRHDVERARRLDETIRSEEREACAIPLRAAFAKLFPNYLWTDPQTTIDRMVEEIMKCRVDLDVTLRELRAVMRADKSNAAAIRARGGQ